MEPEHHQDKCTCDKTGSESDVSGKEKRSKIGLFNLRKSRVFSGKRSKKPTTTQSPSCKWVSAILIIGQQGLDVGFNLVKRSTKWSIKFNCTGRKSTKMLPSHEANRVCCRCTCPKSAENETNQAEAELPSTSSSHSDQPRGSIDVDLSEEPNRNVPEDNGEDNAQAAPHPDPPVVQVEQAEGVRGIYGTAMGANGAPSGVVVAAPFVDIPW